MVSLEDLNLEYSEISSMRATSSFLQAKKLKNFRSSGVIACAWDAFCDEPPRSVDWGSFSIDDDQVSFLVQILGEDRCEKIQEIYLSMSAITEKSVALISKKND